LTPKGSDNLGWSRCFFGTIIRTQRTPSVLKGRDSQMLIPQIALFICNVVFFQESKVFLFEGLLAMVHFLIIDISSDDFNG
ncbi:MAG: hypothetical protein OEV30_10175, partial [Ignavibacteria bacterium]|nr:hypothetical protein [Ignavibacteria bacterium]